MMRQPLRSSAGFTYITAIVMVVLMGIILSKGAQVWSMRMQREREVELIFRGTQVRDALRRWYGYKCPSTTGNTGAPQTNQTGTQTGANALPKHGPLPELKALVTDPSLASKARYLRPSNLIDPMTGKEWALVKDASQTIIGVASASEAAPIKQANFPFDLEPADFEGKKKYSEWQFIYNRCPKPGATGGGVTGLKTSNSPTTQSPNPQSPSGTSSTPSGSP